MVNILYGFVLHIYPGIDVIQAELPRDDDDGAEHFMDSHVGGLRITTKVEFRGDGWRPVSLTCKHVIYYKTVQVTQRLIKKIRILNYQSTKIIKKINILAYM